MRRKLSIEEIKIKLYQIHGDVVLLDEPTYIDTKTKCRFVDIDYGEWWSTPNNVIHQKKGHKRRGIKKSQETMISLYGAPFGLQSKKIREKINKSKRYTIEEIRHILFQKYNDLIIIKESEYVDAHTLCTFIDKQYGPWLSRLSNIISGHGHPLRGQAQAKITNIERYGDEYPVRNPIVYKKHLRSCNNVFSLIHWNTQKELLCKGSYEREVVIWLNSNKIKFLWQPKSFKTPIGREYTPDLYLTDKNLWIEIKGWLNRNPISKEKWLWFHKEHPNSELWDRKKLLSMGVKVS